MSTADIRLDQLPTPDRAGGTRREDAWWVQPLLVVLGLGAFIVYSTWAAFQGVHFFANGANPSRALFGGAESTAHYLSPMYSPVLFDPPAVQLMESAGQPVSGHAWFPAPEWLLNAWPTFLVFSPAFLILWAPGLFRFTCYYYRGAYYKAFWGDPFNCAVGEPQWRGRGYRGERWFPLILQNVHRYTLYIALLFIGILSWDALLSYRFTNAAAEAEFGFAVGSLVLTINPILLGGYTFGCHSFRHLVGGRKDTIGASGPRRAAYDGVSCLNRKHMQWAWASLIWVGFTDVYVRLTSMGIWTDWRII